MASEECKRAQDRFAVLEGSARFCEQMEECDVSISDLIAMGNAYFEADYICGAGKVATGPAEAPEGAIPP